MILAFPAPAIVLAACESPAAGTPEVPCDDHHTVVVLGPADGFALVFWLLAAAALLAVAAALTIRLVHSIQASVRSHRPRRGETAVSGRVAGGAGGPAGGRRRP